MKKISIVLILLVLAIVSCKNKEKSVEKLDFGAFELSSKHLMPGKTFNIEFKDTTGTAKGLYYYAVYNHVYPVDIHFSKENKATVTLPDSAKAIALNIEVDGKKLDNNKKGYLLTLSDSDKNELPGSRASLASILLMFNNGRDLDLDLDRDSLVQLIGNDIQTHPELKDKFNQMYVYWLYRTDKKKAVKLAHTLIDSLKNKEELTKKDYASIIDLYRTIRNTKAADSVRAIALSKYPGGEMARQDLQSKFYKERDLLKKEAIFKEYTELSPENDQLENYLANNLASGFYKKGDIDKFKEYAALITDPSVKASLYNSIAWPLAEKGKDLDFAANISKQSLDLIKESKNDLSFKPDFYTESQYINALNQNYNMFADTYALIEYKKGNIKEALKYQSLAVKDYASTDVHERYLEYLIADKQFEKAKNHAENIITNGHLNKKIEEFYKTAFLKTDPDRSKFETRLAELKGKARQKHIDELTAKMTNEKAPDFTLKDLDGNDVTLESLKGKVVILDFWATWCGPCIASFPGMKMAVDKYKNDPNVAFLFIDTFERGKNRKKNVASFISKNKYDFHVLLDNENESGNFIVADKYGVTGIPTKAVIDPEGNLRLKLVGFGGNSEKIVDEIGLILDLLKK